MRFGALLPLPLLVVVVVVLLHAARGAGASGGGDNGSSCNRSCGSMELPYPFGFSSGCTIQLGCDGDGGALLRVDARELGLRVRNVTPRALVVDIATNCSRPLNQSLDDLFTANYAPSVRNGILLGSCRHGEASNCTVNFSNKVHHNCAANKSFACLLPRPNDTVYERGAFHENGCSQLVASAYVDAISQSSQLLELDVLELDWWVKGQCRCSKNANCTRIAAPTDAFRCECLEGFEGDGFVDGAGCRRVPKCELSKFLSGACGKALQIGLVVAGVIFGAMVMGATCQAYHVLKRRSASMRSRQSTKRLLSEASCTVPFYSYREIERATCGFSEEQLLGTGAYGTVYAGRLSDNRLVAVKRIKQRDPDAGLDGIMNEVKLVSSVSHRNLVRLLGCCVEQGQQILVYEFMPNGTLAQHLQRERGPSVPWTVRLRMATETAKAIAYLHSEVHPPIYHRDIKSSNILLDHEYNSKVADFGLSRMGMTSFDSSHISTAPQGTPGYVDPQYHQNFHLSDKSDVYSFGVVLVEIITAMKVVDFSRAPSAVNLAQLAIEKIGKGFVDDIVDPYLEPHRDAWTLTSIHKVAELAFRCLAFHSEIRPSMAEVADELEQIQLSGWAPSTDDAAFMSTTSSLCSSAPSRATDTSLVGTGKSRRAEAVAPAVNAAAAQETAAAKRAANSPVSVQERWFSDRSSPSSNSLLGNSLH